MLQSKLSSRFFTTACVAVFALLSGCSSSIKTNNQEIQSVKAVAAPVLHRDKNQNPSATYKWSEILLEASGRDVDRYGARPTILSRTMAIVLTAMYDAWSAFDERAIGTQISPTLRRPANERTLANKETAIAYAAYRSLLDVYPQDRAWLATQMKKMGYDPSNASEDTKSAIGIGNLSARLVTENRHRDGANQLGDEVGSTGKPYSDYTFYRPKNTPDRVVDYLTWMPIEFSDGKGGHVKPGFLTPHWYRVKPFALKRADQFRSTPPPQYNSSELSKEVDEVIHANANLTLEQKAIVEFMRDGPRSTGQSGHWLQFAQDVSRRDGYNIDQDVKLFFVVSNVVFDGFIACWEVKRFYDTSRPYWWTRLMKKGQTLRGWAGPGKGVMNIKAEDWLPYSPENFITPPFPGYVSGHATVSAAAAKMLELFTGSDYFNAIEKREAGRLTESGFSTAKMQAVDGRENQQVASSPEITLKLPTFSATAEMAAISRLWGGYHIRSDNEEGLALGRKVAEYSWPIFKRYLVPDSETVRQSGQ